MNNKGYISKSEKNKPLTAALSHASKENIENKHLPAKSPNMKRGWEGWKTARNQTLANLYSTICSGMFWI
jgi:hypothetical protein